MHETFYDLPLRIIHQSGNTNNDTAPRERGELSKATGPPQSPNLAATGRRNPLSRIPAPGYEIKKKKKKKKGRVWFG